MEGSGGWASGMLSRQAIQVDLASQGFALALGATTRIAAIRSRFNIPLGDFIPPLLLSCAPYLLLAAGDAFEGQVSVVATLHEIGLPVAV